MNIGIDELRHFIYESTDTLGAALWPPPVLTCAKIVDPNSEPIIAEDRRDAIGNVCIFREDSFDPAARIRRGRFYFSGNQQPIDWSCYAHPADPYEKPDSWDLLIKKRLSTFYGRPLGERLPKAKGVQPLVLLGFKERFTIWSIIDVEAISTGEDLVTLKARSVFGVLPLVEEKKIPEVHRSAVIESLDGFADEVHRSAPISVIDRARDAASQILLAYFEATSENARDLAKLAPRLDTENKMVAAWAVRIIARLHARAKPVEKVKRKTRPIRLQDAELATQCVGTVLCELGWADWP